LQRHGADRASRTVFENYLWSYLRFTNDLFQQLFIC
jgi:hypothetical protein